MLIFDIYVAKDFVLENGSDGIPRAVEMDERYSVLRSEVLRRYQQEDTTQTADFSFNWDGSRWRGHLFFSTDGWVINGRRLTEGCEDLASLGFRPEHVTAVCSGVGLVLFIGPTGSGKSTSIVAASEELAKHGKRGLTVTIEDPVEYVYTDKLVFQREVGTHTKSMADGVREAVRERPKTIIIGEIRDPETAYAAILAGLSGHRVLASIHAKDIREGISRMLILLGEENSRMFYESVQGYVAQNLIWSDDNQDGKPVLIYETLLHDEQVKSCIKRGPDYLQQLVHEFDRQKRFRMHEMGMTLNKIGRIRRDQLENAIGANVR